MIASRIPKAAQRHDPSVTVSGHRPGGAGKGIMRSYVYSPIRWLTVGGLLATCAYAALFLRGWSRYGHPTRAVGNEVDPLLDRFLPTYEVVERFSVRVDAPAEVALEAATGLDIRQSALIRTLFAARAWIMGAAPDETARPWALLAWVQSLGWSLLAEVPGREVVVGTITRPWEATPTPRIVAPSEFASFDEPGYVKIGWILRADPVDASTSIVRHETRVAATDPTARARFRRYWSFASPGMELIRWLLRGHVKRVAEHQVRVAAPSQRGRKTLHMVNIEGEIVINRPVEEVFDVVADERNEPHYNPRLLWVEKISSGPIGRGTRFRAATKTMGRPIEMTIEFTEFERPRRLESSTHMPTMKIQGTLTFDPVPEGTRMRWSWALQPHGVLRLLGPLITRMGQRQEEAIWAGLKRFMEAQG